MPLEELAGSASDGHRRSGVGTATGKAFSLVQEGIAMTMLGRLDDGLTLIRGYSEAIGATRALYAAICRTFEAQACLWAGKLVDARAALEGAFAATQRYNERHWETETHRLDGELRLVENPDAVESSEACFLKALDISRGQEARSLELRAATSLGRLWQRQGRSREAKDLLLPIYKLFGEALDTADLTEACALLTSFR